MENRSLSDKYRPKVLSEIVGQDEVVSTLVSAFKKRKLFQKICLIGDSGVGKTTVGLCLARALNCENFDYNTMKLCGECFTCRAPIRNLAAFNYISCGESGATQAEIANLVRLSSVSSVLVKNRVIFLDEIHEWYDRQSKLTSLLDTLPNNTYIICATYKPEKMEKAFIRRFQCLEFGLPSEEDICKYLKKICVSEGCLVPDEKILRIARKFEGDPREAVNQLERFITNM